MAAVVTIRVVQRDGCGFEITQAADENVLPRTSPDREAALLAMTAMARTLRQLHPEVVMELGPLRDLLRQFGDLDGAP